MNVFYLHQRSKECAQMHCDRHVIKMMLECAQLLSTAHRVLAGSPGMLKNKKGELVPYDYVHPWDLEDGTPFLYRAAHINHPCSKWVREAHGNYMYTWGLFGYLHDEWKLRFGATRNHASFAKFMRPGHNGTYVCQLNGQVSGKNLQYPPASANI
jgi:hypothetical protein